MADIADGSGPTRPTRRLSFARLIANPAFQSFVARTPLLRSFARRDGEALMDLVAGFVNAQVLSACVKLDLFQRLLDDGPLSPEALSAGTGIPSDRMTRLLDAAVALDLLRRRGARYDLSRKGAATLGVPGLQAMIRHHDVFYRDLADPLALLRGKRETELAAFWPYVFGAGDPGDADIRGHYSELMADSQKLVAEDTLRMVSFAGTQRLLDVGGGSGAFALAVAQAYPALQVAVFDLPGVAGSAAGRFKAEGADQRLTIHEGSFRDDPLPDGADAISLIRVLYDHEDHTVLALLKKAFAALPAGGRLIISEPMTGGETPHRAGDVYFNFYTMAMGTGTARSPARIAELCAQAGFSDIRIPRAPRAFITSAVVASK